MAYCKKLFVAGVATLFGTITAFSSPAKGELQSPKTGKYTTDQPCITIKMEKGIKNAPIGIDAFKEDRSSIWFDLNDNGVYDAGEEVTEWENSVVTYQTKSNSLKMYGQIRAANLAEMKLTKVEFSKDHPMQNLNVAANPHLSSIDISELKDLRVFHGFESNIPQVLDLTHAPLIENVDICDSSFTGILLPQGAKLKKLFFKSAKVTQIDLSPCAEIVKLCGGYNPLKKIEMGKFKTMTCLSLPGCSLEEIDVKENKELVELYLSENRLKKVDISNCPELIWVDCAYNQLTSLDVSSNKNIEYLWLDNNCISAEEMLKLCKILPDRNWTMKHPGHIWVINTLNEKEQNVCIVEAVDKARDLNWITLDARNRDYSANHRYNGSNGTSVDSPENLGIITQWVNGSLLVSVPESMEGKILSLVAMNGHTLYRESATAQQTISFKNKPRGVYLLCIGDKSTKIIL